MPPAGNHRGCPYKISLLRVAEWSFRLVQCNSSFHVPSQGFGSEGKGLARGLHRFRKAACLGIGSRQRIERGGILGAGQLHCPRC